jgi:hypothetical protein
LDPRHPKKRPLPEIGVAVKAVSPDGERWRISARA